MRAPTPSLWKLLARLLAAGCPVDIEYLPPPDHPLRLTVRRAVGGAEVFPIEGATAIVVRLVILARSRFFFRDFRLQADWLAGPVQWVTECPEHSSGSDLHYCLPGHKINFPALETLNRLVNPGHALESGMHVDGWLVGYVATPLEHSAETRTAMLWIENFYGDEYPYPLTLRQQAFFRHTGEENEKN